MGERFEPLRDFTKIHNILIKSKYLTPVAFRVYCYIASYKRAYPSYDVIHRDLGLARATISKAIKELVKKGLIAYQKGSHRRNANEYWLLPFRYWRLNPHCADRTAPFRLHARHHRKKNDQISVDDLVEKLYQLSSENELDSDSDFESHHVQNLNHTETELQDEYVEYEEEDGRVPTARRLVLSDTDEPELPDEYYTWTR